MKKHPVIQKYLSERARIAGRSGKGQSKRRGDHDYYVQLGKLPKKK